MVDLVYSFLIGFDLPIPGPISVLMGLYCPVLLYPKGISLFSSMFTFHARLPLIPNFSLQLSSESISIHMEKAIQVSLTTIQQLQSTESTQGFMAEDSM